MSSKVPKLSVITDLFDGTFKVVVEYDTELVSYFRSLPSRMWSSVHKYWYFPTIHLDDIIAELNRRHYIIEQRSIKPTVHITEREGSVSTVCCSPYDPDIYYIINGMQLAWDAKHAVFNIPSDKIDQIIGELNEGGHDYNYSKVEEGNDVDKPKKKQHQSKHKQEEVSFGKGSSHAYIEQPRAVKATKQPNVFFRQQAQ